MTPAVHTEQLSELCWRAWSDECPEVSVEMPTEALAVHHLDAFLRSGEAYKAKAAAS